MKGVSISTELLVALAIALLVLLVLVAMLMGIVPGAGAALGYEADFRVQCNRYISAGGCIEGPGIGVFDGCSATNNCPDCTEASDVTCKYIKCSTAKEALGTCIDKDLVKNSCCGTATATTTP
jgi:hypothetical protein